MRALRGCCLALLLALSGISCVCAADAQPTVAAPASLLDAWLAVPGANTIQWPYAFIRAHGTASAEQDDRKHLLEEFQELIWRLQDGGYPRYVDAVKQWRSHLNAMAEFRVPGQWSPSFLLAHPDKNPPMSSVAAIGFCGVPATVEIWDADGVKTVPWKSGLRLSDVEKSAPALRHGSVPMVAVINSFGDIDRYGVQAWNYADTQVTPGTRIVASMPLKGEAFGYIQDTLAGLLAHALPGPDCRQVSFASAGQDTAAQND